MDGVIDRQALESQISQLEYYLEQARKMLAIADEMGGIGAIGNGAPDRSGKPKRVRKDLRDLQSNLLSPPKRPKLSKPKPVMESAVNSPRKILFTQGSMGHKRMVKILEKYRADRGISNAMFSRLVGVNMLSHAKIMKLDQNVTETMFERYLKLVPELEKVSPKGRFGRKTTVASISASISSGRPAKKVKEESEDEVPSIFDEEGEQEEKPKRRRGRPPAKASKASKAKAEEESEEDEEDEENDNAEDYMDDPEEGENEEHEENDDEFEPVTPTIVYEGESEEEEE